MYKFKRNYNIQYLLTNKNNNINFCYILFGLMRMNELGFSNQNNKINIIENHIEDIINPILSSGNSCDIIIISDKVDRNKVFNVLPKNTNKFVFSMDEDNFQNINNDILPIEFFLNEYNNKQKNVNCVRREREINQWYKLYISKFIIEFMEKKYNKKYDNLIYTRPDVIFRNINLDLNFSFLKEKLFNSIYFNAAITFFIGRELLDHLSQFVFNYGDYSLIIERYKQFPFYGYPEYENMSVHIWQHAPEVQLVEHFFKLPNVKIHDSGNYVHLYRDI